MSSTQNKGIAKQVTYINIYGKPETLDVIVRHVRRGDVVAAPKYNVQKIRHAKKNSTTVYVYRNDGSVFSFKRKFELLNDEQTSALFNELLNENNLQVKE